MSLVRWNPSRDLLAFPSDLLSMQRDINRIFDSFFRTGWEGDTGLAPTAWSPATDVAEQADRYLVKVELPGMPHSPLCEEAGRTVCSLLRNICCGAGREFLCPWHRMCS